MKVICLHDRDEIEAYLRRDVYQHLYELGDLDDFFWQHTTWYALQDQGRVQQALLLYTGTGDPVLLGLASEPLTGLKALLRHAAGFLPRRFYAHFSGDAVTALEADYRYVSHGLHHKMALLDPARAAGVDTSAVVRLSGSDLPELQAFYAASYPENWFDPRMLETGCYYGIRQDGQLASVAGIHVYSPRYRVAVLGNITTHPEYRGRGLCTAVSARLCQALLPDMEHIGLNVKAGNQSAITCYRKLGFQWVASYEEYSLEARPLSPAQP